MNILDLLLERLRPAEIAAAFIVNLVLSLVIIAVGVILARTLKRRLVGAITRARGDDHLAVLLGNTALAGMLLVTLLLVLRVYGLDATALVAVLGIGTVAIGLALQDLLKSIFAGIYLLLERPFRLGDTLVIDSREGTVERVDVRTTTLRLPDGTQALIPNAIVFATTVMNRTANPTRRFSIRLSGLSDELSAIEAGVQAVLKDQPTVAATPAPQTRLEAVSDGKTTVVIDLWRPAGSERPSDLLPILQRAFPGADVAIKE